MPIADPRSRSSFASTAACSELNTVLPYGSMKRAQAVVRMRDRDKSVHPVVRVEEPHLLASLGLQPHRDRHGYMIAGRGALERQVCDDEPTPASLGPEEGPMATLHIEHPISDLGTWLEAFNRFADARRDAGVTAQRIHQPTDDDEYIVVQLDFGSIDAAEQFKSFLESVIWQSTDLSPGLAGSPRARVLREVS